MKSSLIYNPLVLAVITGLALSLSACGGGSGSSGGSENHDKTDSSGNNGGGKVTKVDTYENVKLELSPADLKVVGCSSFNKKEAQKKILKQLNTIRAQSITCLKTNKKFNATHPLKWSDTLEKSTRKFAYDMANHDYYDYFGTNAHLQPDTSKAKPWKIKDAITFDDRAKEFEYLNPKETAGFTRENLAWSKNPNKPDIQTAVNTAYYGDGVSSVGWLKSTHGHCESIMSPEVEDFAMTCAYNPKTNKYYFVQTFGVNCTLETCEDKGLGYLIKKP